MADLPFEIVLRDRNETPFGYTLAPGERFTIQSITAQFDASQAAGEFSPALALYSQDGVLLSRTFPSELLQPEAVVSEVTYAPF